MKFRREKLPQTVLASDLLEDRKRGLNKVFVMTDGSPGYWGRGWSVQTALRNAQWITRPAAVLVFLCNDQTYCGEISGGVNGKHGTVYAGKVTADRDVKITHKLVPEE